ncbi:MAG: DUF3883 domain-containing protein [Firmicutes bacterium]|jgi:hypothetical protein|nr:DUF3883 domain-containing protein [Bacillota bacterium]
MRISLLNSDLSELVTNYDINIVDQFLDYYNEESHLVYISAIKIMIEMIGNKSFVDYKHSDYLKIKKSLNHETSQDKFRKSFIKFLYAFDYLNDDTGFENEWIKNSERQIFDNRHNRNNIKEKTSIKLSIDDINKIEKLTNCDKLASMDTLFMSFVAYMAYKTDCSLNKLRTKTKFSDYNDGNLEINGDGLYLIGRKYNRLFEYFISETRSTGFNGRKLNEGMDLINEFLSLDETITMEDIRLARKQNMIKCCNCGDSYTADSSNWKVKKNRIVCLYCAENLYEPINEENIIDDMESFLNDRELKTKNYDYLSIYEKKLIVGELSEKFVYEYERQKLKGTKYYELVDPSKAKNPQNGYDILSYNSDGEKIRIEVKGTISKDIKEFYISQNEVKCAKKFLNDNQKYYIYCVSNIFANNLSEIKLGCIKNLFDKNNYYLTVENWRVNIKNLDK